MRGRLGAAGWREGVGVLVLGVYILTLVPMNTVGMAGATALLVAAALAALLRDRSNGWRRTAAPTAVLVGGLWTALYRVRTEAPDLNREGELSGFQEGLESTQSILPPILYVALALVAAIWLMVLVSRAFPDTAATKDE